MKKILSVFDVSSFIHAGHVNKRAFLEQYVQKDIPGRSMTWCTQRTPAGGTAFLLKSVIPVSRRGDVVLCCDRNPTIKKAMLPTYKSNRDHKSSIETDKKLAEYVLNSCGMTVLHADGYEADDIIYTVVRQCYDMYDEIHVYTGDSDLYFLVDNKVSIKPSSSRAKEVTMENFPYQFKKGIEIPYNYAIPYKILHGDSSDCIPPLDKKYARIFYEGTTRGATAESCGIKEVLDFLIYEVYPFAKESYEIIHPLFVEDVPTYFKAPDIQMMFNWASTMHCGEYIGMESKSFNAEPMIAEIQSMGLYEEE